MQPFFAVDMRTVIIGPHMAGPNGVGGRQSSVTTGTLVTLTERLHRATLPRPDPPPVNINTVEREAKMLPVWNRTKCGLSSVEKLNSKLPQLELSDASVI